jgi:hypothetical protein
MMQMLLKGWLGNGDDGGIKFELVNELVGEKFKGGGFTT